MDVGSVTRQVFAILLVFALLGFTLWKLRRAGSPLALRTPWRRNAGGARAIESVERLALTPQHALHLIRVQGREIVVATHPQGCTLLSNASLGHKPTGAGA
jgi:flagellar biogenesis protein FliO